jgi:cobalt-zinc-cadmium efflux system membrane fusion protein
MFSRIILEVSRLGIVAGVLVFAGCGEQSSTSPTTTAGKGGAANAEEHATHSHSHAGDTHDGWWCPEHGVPEEKCGLCNSKLAAEMKRKGDWCKEHDRPGSQCFVCHPELEAKFAAEYEAKFGKQPPPRTETKD